jgi:hypothetical protein
MRLTEGTKRGSNRTTLMRPNCLLLNVPSSSTKWILSPINNEAKARRSIKSDVLGTAKVMSYEDLEKAKAERATKETAKEAKKAEKEVKKAKSEAKKVENEAKKAAREVEQAKSTRGRKHKSSAEADAMEPKDKVARMSEIYVAENETTPTPWRAPVARMW